jgi:flagellar L-ring protein FlgH
MKMNPKNWIITLLLPVTLVGAPALAADDAPSLPDGYQVAGADNINQVRPQKDRAPVVSAAPNHPMRGSLYGNAVSTPVPIGPDGNPINSAPASFIDVQPSQPKKFKKNDIVTIIVEEDSTYTSSAQSQSQKQQDFDLALQSWLQLHSSPSGIPNQVTSVGSSGTLPEAKFKYDNNRQNQSSQQRADSLSYRIAATVVDVKPNGTVIVEAVKQLTVDREVQVYRLSGTCRAEDVTPDNTVLSTQLAGLDLSKQTKGEVHDGVKSGWLNSIIDKVNPF